MDSTYQEQKMTHALEAVDKKGNIVLQKNGEDALLFMPGAVAEFCIAHGYDMETCSWSHGSYYSNLTAASMEFSPIETRSDEHAEAIDIDAEIVKKDEWRDGMVEQVSEFMDAIKDMNAQEAKGADTVLSEMLDSFAENSTDAVLDMLETYSHSDTSGRAAIAEVFHALTGESFDGFLMQASDACEQTIGQFGGESLDEMMEQKVEVAGDGDIGEELDVSNGER